MKSEKIISRYFASLVVAVLVGINCLVCWLFIFASSSHGLRVSVLNIGQGDSILVQGPTGRTMLVDGGPDRSVLAGLGSELGPLTRHIDMLVETHPHFDHIHGFAYVLKGYNVSQLMTSGMLNNTAAFQDIEMLASSTPGPVRVTARRGMRIDLGGGAYADVLYPDRDVSKETSANIDDGSIVLKVVYGKTSFLLTGDLPSTVEHWLIQLDRLDGVLKSNVLKVGHHGSKYSTSSEWLAAVNPQQAAISVGKNNIYGHPTPEVLARIKQQGAKVLETELVGTIDFVSDGTKITQSSEGL